VGARADWQTDTAGIGGIAPERLVFVDESAILTSMARRYGRSPRGQRASAKVPFGNWKRLSVLSALGIEGFLATMSVEAATDGAIFAAYLEQVLLPVLHAQVAQTPFSPLEIIILATYILSCHSCTALPFPKSSSAFEAMPALFFSSV